MRNCARGCGCGKMQLWAVAPVAELTMISACVDPTSMASGFVSSFGGEAAFSVKFDID